MSGLAFGILGILRQREQTISDIGRHMMISPPALVPVIDALERQGLVQRGRDPNDRRRTPLLVTDEGRRVLASVPVMDRDDVLVRSLEAIGQERASLLLDLLREVVERMWRSGHADTERSIVDVLHESARRQFETPDGKSEVDEMVIAGLAMAPECPITSKEA